MKSSKVLNSVQGETYTADLPSVISEEKENIFPQNDRIDLTNCDTELTAQDSPPRKRAKNFDAECVIMGAELSVITINYAQELLKRAEWPPVNPLTRKENRIVRS